MEDSATEFGKRGSGVAKRRWSPRRTAVPTRFAVLSRFGITALLLALFAGIFLNGCSTFPTESKVPGKEDRGNNGSELKNKLVALSEPMARERPVLLLLHGATEDIWEMAALGERWTNTYNVFLYCYDFHDPLEKIASALVVQMKKLRSLEELTGLNEEGNEMLTVVVYSYAAAVFRKAVLLSDDDTLFAGASLVQLVPTAGGSFLARKMGNPLLASLVKRASRPSAAENPYGSIAEELWNEEGNRKFCEIISPARTYTLLVEDDSHSLAQSGDEELRRHYQNGIGTNVIVIPKGTGITHENFPHHPAAIQYLAKLLRAPADLLSEGVQISRETNTLQATGQGDEKRARTEGLPDHRRNPRPIAD